jgi:hypothetical protein
VFGNPRRGTLAKESNPVSGGGREVMCNHREAFSETGESVLYEIAAAADNQSSYGFF